MQPGIVNALSNQVLKFERGWHTKKPVNLVAKGLKLDPKTTALFLLLHTSLNGKPKLESDAVLSLVTIAHAWSA